MSAYAVAIIREIKFSPDIRKYFERIDETLRPYSGRFRIHGGPYENVEGTWNSDLVVIEFPDIEKARQRYNSRLSPPNSAQPNQFSGKNNSSKTISFAINP
jgi:uncharacterized protein (DUF1330 family)